MSTSEAMPQAPQEMEEAKRDLTKARQRVTDAEQDLKDAEQRVTDADQDLIDAKQDLKDAKQKLKEAERDYTKDFNEENPKASKSDLLDMLAIKLVPFNDNIKEKAAERKDRAAERKERAAELIALRQQPEGIVRTTKEILEMTFANVKTNPRIYSSNTTSSNTTTSVAATYLMAPLKLSLWTDFQENVRNSTAKFPNIELDDPFVPIEGLPCSGEAGIHAYGDYTLFKAIRILMKCLKQHSTEEKFKDLLSFFSSDLIINDGFFSCSEGGGLIGDPDRIWIPSGYELAKLIVEFKTPWELGDVENLISEYQDECKQLEQKRATCKGKFMQAVEQTYIYMTINRHRYGCLSTFNQTWFFKRVEDPTDPQTSLLHISPAISCSSKEPYTLTSAWIYLLLTIEKDAGWLDSSPRSSVVAKPYFALNKTIESFRENDRYNSIPLDGLVHWDKIIARSQAGAVATGSFMNMKNLIFKTIDISKRIDGLKQFNLEVSVYKTLEDLQGFCVPRLIAYGQLGGLLQIIILENAGKCITREQAEQRQSEIDTALQQIHGKGIEHNDLRLPNILIDEQNKIRIIDFGMSLFQDGNIDETFFPDDD